MALSSYLLLCLFATVAVTAGINRSNTAARAVLEQPCSTGGRTDTVRPKREPTGRTDLSDRSRLVLCNRSQELIGQACPTRRQMLRSDSACPTTGRTRLFEHRSNCRVRPVNAGSAPKITREDCGKALRKFTSESNVVFWSGKGHYHSCGTCRVAITKPSLPDTTHHAAVFSDVLVALHRGYDQCQGTPTNSTIGNYQSVSVLLDVGNGEQCSD
ncbi:hypothetical protein PCANC_27534 [Puccinia coronata f. sp. avenae]|uniref:Uncharacterized protein n=1 Tax=Puccinia coronata f. sp. avenae TaxID=200324 RepID=A0A2N5TGW3_9BASI|nr:hypothetical protein PCANC_27534 [Puccinia coronata f. sp. avenae]PLW39808.1 hypothetical protein PCASD_10708 [Puccinia coronata f. sp. avenae]